MCWDEFRIRFRIFRTLVRRFFSPRDSFFFNSIVFDIWYVACNAEILGEIAERAGVVINDSDQEIEIRFKWIAANKKLEPKLSLCQF